MKQACKKRAFSLVELMVVLTLFAFVLSAAFITGTSMIKRYSDRRSDFRVEGEVEEAAEWLRSVITRALWNKSDFTLRVSADDVESRMSVEWKTTGERESWNAENVAFKTAGNATGVFSNYSYRYQTLTPALSIIVYYKDDRHTRAGWTISASGYGYVRAYR
ncbi:MAG: type II secretion system GspH family protein [Synergistaceae bacterium]|jgi:prepilin-type N-terminal cleavage/methylation domain-containing protein|nr:type II secretion system GspH family protein [Synergistaceae bacterium]